MIRQFFGTASLQILGKLLTLLTGVIVARVLGPSEYGFYSFIISIVTVSVIPTIAGLPQLLIREIAIFLSNDEYSRLRGIITWSNIYTGCVSLVVMFILYLINYFSLIDAAVSNLLLVAMLMVPLRGFLSKSTAIINAFNKPQLAQIPANLVWPFMVMLIIVLMYFSGLVIDAQLLVKIQIISLIISTVFCLVVIYKNLNFGSHDVVPNYSIKYWHKSLFPFTVVFVFTNLNSELATLFLGFLNDSIQVGLFKVAAQGAALILIFMQSINAITSPKIAYLYKQGETGKLQKLLNKSVRTTSLTSIPFLIVFLSLGKNIITFIFGEIYSPAYSVLSILSIAYFINVIVGPVGPILNMTGNERYCLISLVFAAFVNLTVLLILSPIYGAVGAALSVFTSSLIYNFIMAYFVKVKTGLIPWFQI